LEWQATQLESNMGFICSEYVITTSGSTWSIRSFSLAFVQEIIKKASVIVKIDCVILMSIIVF